MAASFPLEFNESVNGFLFTPESPATESPTYPGVMTTGSTGKIKINKVIGSSVKINV